MRLKGELKQINSIVDKGKKIRFLMDLLERKNIQLKYLKNKIREFQLNASQQGNAADAKKLCLFCISLNERSLDGKYCWNCGRDLRG